MEIEALHGLAIIIIPIITIGILKRKSTIASMLTLFYLLWAIYTLNRINEGLFFLIKGVFKGSLISLIVLSSMYFYNVYKYLGYEKKVVKLLSKKKDIQLTLATFFAGFIESISGFGIPVAVVSPLLYSMNVPAVVAVSSVMIGHAWAVPFASMGVPTEVLATLSNNDVFTISFLTGSFMMLSLVVAIFIISKLLGISQLKAMIYSLMTLLIYPIVLIFGPITGLVAGIIFFIISAMESLGLKDTWRVLKELKPYLFLTIVLMIALILRFNKLEFISILITLSGIIIQIFSRNISVKPIINTIKIAWRPFITITIFAAITEIASQTGLMVSLAKVIASTLGVYYFYIVPIIGAIGAYFTGSNTTSNIVFSKIQESYAEIMNIDELQILALQNTGGGIGSMSSPFKIAVGTSTISNENIESDVFRTIIRFLPIILVPQVMIAILLLIKS